MKVDFPEPFGPSRPRTSPSRTTRLTLRSACTPRNAFARPAISSTTGESARSAGAVLCDEAPAADPLEPHRHAGRAPHGACAQPSEYALGHEEDDEHQHEADHRLARDRIVAGGKGIHQRRDDRRADGRTRPVPRAAQDAHQHHGQRHGDRERLADGDVGHEQRVDASRHAGECARQRKGRELEAVGRHAHHLGDVLVVVDREQAASETRAGHQIRGQHGHERECQRQQVKRRRRVAADVGQRHGAQIDTGAAVDRRVEDDGRQHECHGEREEREHLAAHAADAEHDEAHGKRERRGDRGGGRQRPQERHVVARRERGRGVDARAEERAVPERDVTRVTGQDVP